MGRSLTVCVLDQATDERLTSLDVRLNPIGKPGELHAAWSADGAFSFSNIPAGKYSLAVYDPQNYYAPLFHRVDLDAAENHLVDVRVTPGAFISGEILDEEGRPPRRGYITLLGVGERAGKTGYISRWGDHQITNDGHFSSPPLYPGHYILRISGILQESIAGESSGATRSALQERCFDFLYPNSRTLDRATGFDLAVGELRSGLQVQIPRPHWHTIRGQIMSNLPLAEKQVSVMFSWDPGAIDPIGGSGGCRIAADGNFELMLQPGRYIVEVSEFSSPGPEGRIHLIRSFAKTVIDVPDHDVTGLQLPAFVVG